MPRVRIRESQIAKKSKVVDILAKMADNISAMLLKASDRSQIIEVASKTKSKIGPLSSSQALNKQKDRWLDRERDIYNVHNAQ